MDQWNNETMDHWTNAPMDHSPMDQWSIGPTYHWSNGPIDQLSNGPMDQWHLIERSSFSTIELALFWTFWRQDFGQNLSLNWEWEKVLWCCVVKRQWIEKEFDSPDVVTWIQWTPIFIVIPKVIRIHRSLNVETFQELRMRSWVTLELSGHWWLMWLVGFDPFGEPVIVLLLAVKLTLDWNSFWKWCLKICYMGTWMYTN